MPRPRNRPTRILESFGRVPLPPYIRGGNMVDDDVANYQTVYAQRPGAIAAPTAGLHFTRELLKTLDARGVTSRALHCMSDLGLFARSRANRWDEHRMHGEWGELSPRPRRAQSDARRRADESLQWARRLCDS